MSVCSQDPPQACRLPVQFDALGLQADLATLGATEWTAHFNTGFFNGDWSGVALRSVAGSNTPMYADATHARFTDTELLQQCQHLRAVVQSFQCPLRSVRLLRLTAGSNIREHRDYDLGYDLGEVRVHVPVMTNPDVEFYLDGRRIVMNEGECWYLDLNRPHRVQNRGLTDRVHLVVDCQLNDWLRDLIARGTRCEGDEGSFEGFRRCVLAEPALQGELVAITDEAEFMRRAVALGQQLGFNFLPSDVEAAIFAARRAWVQRWSV